MRIALSLALLLLAGCERRSDDVAVEVSIIDGTIRPTDPARGTFDEGARATLAALAEGLVRFDAAGQVEPALAERWTVIDDGRSYIFRLRDATWPDGRRVTAGDVVTALRRASAPGARNPAAPLLTAVTDVVEMTPQVIELRLARPMPELLTLLAQPELSVFRTRTLTGAGPFRRAAAPGMLLRPVADPDNEDDPVDPDPARDVRLRGERAAIAIARFATKGSDMVTGGTFADFPLLAHADIPPASIRLDPAVGLFGLSFEERSGWLADVANRAAVAMAIDPSGLPQTFGAEWPAAATLLPAPTDTAAPAPLGFAWANTPLPARIAAARAHIDALRAAGEIPPPLRISLPDGPGATLLMGMLAADLRRIGLSAERVPADAPADLRVIDAVAPLDTTTWYLATACRRCPQEVRAQIDAAQAAAGDERTALVRVAEQAVVADIAFVPIARPLRWSLVAPRLRAWQANARAWHPLNHLRNDTN